ncbi:aminopeptidase N C-terminal domain-containing protein, partial [Escherichia fergusonii]|uniref:aminopeptidase N C-terminal domain-containing protein n=1 Tax=Escherichia fergusonii TaxID=564 RepID=UPI003EE2F06A
LTDLNSRNPQVASRLIEPLIRLKRYDAKRQEKMRVALARALIHRPGLLLLDEPLGALDALTRLEMQDLIVSLWQEHGFTVLLVTHDVSEAVAMADRVLLIEEGKIGLDLTVDIPRPRRLGAVRLAELEAEVLQRVMQRGESETRLRKQG